MFLQGVHDLLPLISTRSGRWAASRRRPRRGGAGDAVVGVPGDAEDPVRRGQPVLKIIGPAIGDFLQAFGEAGARSGPAVTGLARGARLDRPGARGDVRDLAPAAPAIGVILASLGGLIGTLAGTLGQVAATILKALAPDIKAICDALASPGVLGAITGVVGALTDLIERVPPKVVADLALALLAVGAAMKTIDIVQGAVGRISGVVATLKGLAGKLFGTGTAEVGAAGMRRAGDAIAGAAVAMQRAADTMVGADVGDAAG